MAGQVATFLGREEVREQKHEQRLLIPIQEDLIEAAGGTRSVSEVAELLGRPEEAMRQLIRRG